ncbi:MAG: phosphoribosylamine--glycine ligase [Gammaproteobacteria bacterium]|nr:phosphoribosylamine--glycine ligase [Gammaproteobacteria bacterium]MCI0591433.1 phosphoribosylamine--glycine ligase [Gammaproteobacteria bacterium]
MKVLVVGGGGREHALAWKASLSSRVEQVYVAPGNAGTAAESKVENIPIAADDIESLAQFARARAIDLTIVGPEAPLVAGIVDTFEALGLRCFGPRKAAARLEGSKAYAKAFLARHGIPTANAAIFNDTNRAVRYIRQQGAPIVVKADGLAAGKGVIIAQDEAQAIDAVTSMLSGKAFGEAGGRVVIEQFLEGEEASFIVITDGEEALPLATSQDHKPRDDGDLGPNTGGMGAYSPAAIITAPVHNRIMREVIEPTIRGMAEDGYHYSGFLYAGLMIMPNGSPKVLEFNCRLGDPEAQPIFMRLRSDLLAVCNAALDHRLNETRIDWESRVALGVVLAAKGYPGDVRKGDVIRGLERPSSDNVKIFHAGTAFRDSQVVTAGGRVLCVCALADTIPLAQRRAYEAADTITWDGMFYRRDIGFRAVSHESIN